MSFQRLLNGWIIERHWLYSRSLIVIVAALINERQPLGMLMGKKCGCATSKCLLSYDNKIVAAIDWSLLKLLWFCSSLVKASKGLLQTCFGWMCLLIICLVRARRAYKSCEKYELLQWASHHPQFI